MGKGLCAAGTERSGTDRRVGLTRSQAAPGSADQLIASLSIFPGLKATVLLALMVTGSPVCGFLPVRAPRWRCTKVPKPTRVTLSLRFRSEEHTSELQSRPHLV